MSDALSVVVNQKLEGVFKAPSSCLPPTYLHTPRIVFQAPHTLIVCGIPYHVSYIYIHHGQARVAALSTLSMLSISNSALIARKHRPLPQAFHCDIDLDQFSTHLVCTGCQYQKKQCVDTKSVVNLITNPRSYRKAAVLSATTFFEHGENRGTFLRA